MNDPRMNLISELLISDHQEISDQIKLIQTFIQSKDDQLINFIRQLKFSIIRHLYLERKSHVTFL